jgi:hypothetical protein
VELNTPSVDWSTELSLPWDRRRKKTKQHPQGISAKAIPSFIEENVPKKKKFAVLLGHPPLLLFV